jgi:hypothetical protein
MHLPATVRIAFLIVGGRVASSALLIGVSAESMPSTRITSAPSARRACRNSRRPAWSPNSNTLRVDPASRPEIDHCSLPWRSTAIHGQ